MENCSAYFQFTTEDFRAGPCSARLYGGHESTPQQPTAYLLRHRLCINCVVIHEGIARLKITGSGNDKSGQLEISSHHLIIGMLVLTTKSRKSLEIQQHLPTQLHTFIVLLRALKTLPQFFTIVSVLFLRCNLSTFLPTIRRMARERRGAGSSLVSMETP